MKKIAYLTSGKTGLHAFTFKELELLENNGFTFTLFLTQLKKGMFNPKPTWATYTPSFGSAIFGGIKLLVFNPILFFNLLVEAIKDRTVIYLLMSFSFYNVFDRDISSIHCQMGDHKLFIGYFLSKIVNRNLTVTIHAHELYNKFIYQNPALVLKSLMHCDKVITISDFNKRELVNRIGVDSSKIEVMYLYPTNFNDSFSTKKKILIVANWFEKKGYGFLFEALKTLNRNDYVLWIVGGFTKSQYSINIKDLINEYDLNDRVEIFGFQPKNIIDILFYSCDIFCLPSVTDYYPNSKVRDREGIPVAIMEAMRWGKPVISTNHAGIPELVNDFLVEENNVVELKESIEFLLDNPDLYKQFGKNNLENVKEKFNESNINVLINVLTNINENSN